MQVLGLYLHAVNKANVFEQTGLMQILRAIFRSNLAIISQKGGERSDGYSYWLNILLIEILINPNRVFPACLQVLDKEKNWILFFSLREGQNSGLGGKQRVGPWLGPLAQWDRWQSREGLPDGFGGTAAQGVQNLGRFELLFLTEQQIDKLRAHLALFFLLPYFPFPFPFFPFPFPPVEPVENLLSVGIRIV